MGMAAHRSNMKARTSSRSGDQWQDTPSLTVSLAFVVLTVGAVVLASAVATAPALVGAFLAGVATSVVVSFVHRVRTEDRQVGWFVDAGTSER